MGQYPANHGQSLAIAAMTACIGLILAVLAHECRLKFKIHLPKYIIALPMLIPQLSILFGIQVASLYLSDVLLSMGNLVTCILCIPLIYLALDGPAEL